MSALFVLLKQMLFADDTMIYALARTIQGLEEHLQADVFILTQQCLPTVERNGLTFDTCGTSRTYMGYIWPCSVQCHFGTFGTLFPKEQFSKCVFYSYDSFFNPFLYGFPVTVHTKDTSCNFSTLNVIIVANGKIKNASSLEMTNRIAHRIEIWNIRALVEHICDVIDLKFGPRGHQWTNIRYLLPCSVQGHFWGVIQCTCFKMPCNSKTRLGGNNRTYMGCF